ncbi:hypothetical protein A2Z33_02625 [Candidatus Gottesmanbacteria bacterium RBG_16_52_11]|uniref:Uncharacterized protein n=1 Tax=Candidatus Gottesmanbacteria bacterium RBG_16_52_11 TaxID=1798374 RepID=A0A1F5YMI5_9BACT|nr:MAG: hypothetical protein A2Z33_02625 [Candidatus Gottesmanbacteria bacterium RBG_16_52_11]
MCYRELRIAEDRQLKNMVKYHTSAPIVHCLAKAVELAGIASPKRMRRRVAAWVRLKRTSYIKI